MYFCVSCKNSSVFIGLLALLTCFMVFKRACGGREVLQMYFTCLIFTDSCEFVIFYMGNMCCTARPGHQAPPSPPLKARIRSRTRMKTVNAPIRQQMRTAVHRQMSDIRLGLKGEVEKMKTASTAVMEAAGGGSAGLVPDKEMEIDLPVAEDLPVDLREQITDLLQSRSYSTQEEVLEGWIQANICSHNQPLEAKWLIISSFCIYIIDCVSLKLDRRVNIPQVQLVSLAGNRKGCVLHASQGGDLMIETPLMLQFLTALEVIYNENTRQYIPCVVVDSNEQLRKRINSLSKSTLASFHSIDSERITSILIRKGELWESKAFIRKARYDSEAGYVLLSDGAVYLLSEDYSVKDRIPLETLTSASLGSENLTVHTVQGDRVVYLGTAFLEALDRVLERRGLPRLTVRPTNNSFSNTPPYSRSALRVLRAINTQTALREIGKDLLTVLIASLLPHIKDLHYDSHRRHERVLDQQFRARLQELRSVQKAEMHHCPLARGNLQVWSCGKH